MLRVLTLAFLLGSVCPGFAADLALKRVMLSSAGVGYFEYEADVDGTASLGLDVPLEQVDDVLISLVVFDSTGGVGTVELPGRDNTRASFGNLPFGPAALRSPADYLNSLQGVEISVQGPRPMTGRIVHAERDHRDRADGAQATAACGAPHPRDAARRRRHAAIRAGGCRERPGHRSGPARSHRPCAGIAAPRGQPEHAPHHAAQRRHRPSHRARRLCRRGATCGRRPYRLVLPAKDGDPARLQGWAVLENQSGADWNGMALTLQYGNPVTFRQAIYQSYYVQRPEVPVEILGRILPSVDTRAPPAQMAKAASAPAGARRSPPRRHRPRHRRRCSRRARDDGAARPIRCRRPRAPKKPSSSCRMPVVLAAGHYRQCADRRSHRCRQNASTWPPATSRIRCPRSGSPMTPAPRCPPAC